MESLANILEKLAEKYPDDEDVMAAVELAGEEDVEEGEDEMELGLELEAEPESEGGSFDDLFAADMESEDDEEELPPKRK